MKDPKYMSLSELREAIEKYFTMSFDGITNIEELDDIVQYYNRVSEELHRRLSEKIKNLRNCEE